MVKSSSQPLTVWFVVWDVVITVAAWVGAYLIRFDTGIPLVRNHQPDFELCLENLPLVVLLALVSFRVSHLYDVHRLRRFREELAAVGKGTILLTLLVMATSFAQRYQYESRLAVAIFAATTFVGVLSFRRLSWLILGRLRARGYNQSHALVVGSGRLARRTARGLENAAWMGIQTVAYVDDHPPAGPLDHAVLGPIADLPRMVHEHHIEHVFIALPLNRYADARRVFDVLSQSIVDVRTRRRRARARRGVADHDHGPRHDLYWAARKPLPRRQRGRQARDGHAIVADRDSLIVAADGGHRRGD